MAQTWLGRTIDHYRITERIGAGGSGEVFRGVDLSLDRPVAIKVLRPELASDSAVAERFRTEAQTLARLNHPNVATLFRLLWEAELHVMVMEYVEGQTLDQLARRGGPMPPERALPLFLQALAGIDHAHQHGIIHRDIKGSNVMLARLGLVKVMDFGIARALGGTGLTQHGRPVGTPEYMSPEQICGEAIDVRSDIYSLGILLYKLLCNRLPFGAKNQYEAMRAHVECVPLPPRQAVPDLDAGLEHVVLHALEKERDRRFASVGELRAALEEAAPDACRAPMPGLGAFGSAEIDEEGTLDGDTTEVPELATGETPTDEVADATSSALSPTVVVPEAATPPMGLARRLSLRRPVAAASAFATLTVLALAVALGPGPLGAWKGPGRGTEGDAILRDPLQELLAASLESIPLLEVPLVEEPPAPALETVQTKPPEPPRAARRAARRAKRSASRTQPSSAPPAAISAIEEEDEAWIIRRR